MSLFPTPPKSVCFLRLSAIGDVCHAVAVVQGLQRHWPTTSVTWIIGKVEAQLVEGLTGIEFIVFDKEAGFRGFDDVWKKLSGRKFDALVHMQLSLRSSVLTLGIRAKYKVGFNFRRAKEGQWLFTNRKIPDCESAHVMDSFLSFTEYLGVPRQDPKWDLSLSASDEQFAQSIINNASTVVISPAASKDERNWVTERYAEFADFVVEQGYRVIFCGSASERELQLVADIQSHMTHTSINLVGKTTLKELAALLRYARVVLAPDSGPAHLATTQGTPVIGLYGYSNPLRTGPYLSLEHVVSVYAAFAQEQYDRSAEKLPWGARVKGNQIMAAIPTQDVIQKFLAIEGLSKINK